MSVCLASVGRNNEKVSYVVLNIFAIFTHMFDMICVILTIIGLFSLVIIAIWRLVYYIRTEKRVDQLQDSVSTIYNKLTEFMKDNDDD